jgi:Ca2+-binding EF-hand superfamily protein
MRWSNVSIYCVVLLSLEIVRLLDKDKDGKISVQELLQYVTERKDKSEVEIHIEAISNADSDQTKKSK